MNTNTTKNLKINPTLLMELRRKHAIEGFIIELSFNVNVHEISRDFSKKNIVVISCNGIAKAFPINTPLMHIKREVGKCLNADYSSKMKHTSEEIAEMMHTNEANHANYRLAI